MKKTRETLFNKYNIEPNKDRNELIKIFQRSSKYRKDLPLLIKKIQDDKILFEEELFTINDLEIIEQVNKDIKKIEDEEELDDSSFENDSIKNINNKLLYTISNIEENNMYVLFLYYLKEMISRSTKTKMFYYGRKLSNEDRGSVYTNYLQKISNDYIIEIGNLIEANNTATISQIFKYLDDYDDEIFNNIKNKIIKKISLIIEGELVKSENQENVIDNIVYFLSLEYILENNRDLYKSLFFLVEQLSTSKNKYVLFNKVFIIMEKYLNSEKKDKYIKIILNNATNFMNDFLRGNFNVETDNYFSNFIETFKYIELNLFNTLENKDGNFIKSIHSLFSFYKQQSNEWHIKNTELFKSIEKHGESEDVYKYVELNLNNGLGKNNYRFFCNTLLMMMNFDSYLEDITRKKQNLEKVVDNAVKSGYRFFSYRDLFVNTRGYELLRPYDVDLFMGKFYFIIYLLENHEYLFLNFKSYLLTPSRLIDIMENSNRFSANQFRINMIASLPTDWIINGLNISTLLQKTKSSSNYGRSKSGDIVNKYEVLFIGRGLNKPIQEEVIKTNSDNNGCLVVFVFGFILLMAILSSI